MVNKSNGSNSILGKYIMNDQPNVDAAPSLSTRSKNPKRSHKHKHKHEHKHMHHAQDKHPSKGT